MLRDQSIPLSQDPDSLDFYREQQLRQHVERIQSAFWQMQKQAKEFAFCAVELQGEMKKLMALYRKFKAHAKEPKK